MSGDHVFDDPLLQDYVDDRLDEVERVQVAARLTRDPKAAAQVEQLRSQNEMLRIIGNEVLEEPVPKRLREALRSTARNEARGARWASPPRRQPARFMEAAAAILLFVVGGALGWFANGQLKQTQDVEDLLLASAIGAYSFYGAGDYPIDFPPDRSQEFTDWISRTFERDIPRPELVDAGFDYAGGRLVPSSGTRIGLLQYAGDEESRLGVLFWSSESDGPRTLEIEDQTDITTRLWSGGGLTVAVVGPKSLDADIDDLADAVFSTYR